MKILIIWMVTSVCLIVLSCIVSLLILHIILISNLSFGLKLMPDSRSRCFLVVINCGVSRFALATWFHFLLMTLDNHIASLFPQFLGSQPCFTPLAWHHLHHSCSNHLCTGKSIYWQRFWVWVKTIYSNSRILALNVHAYANAWYIIFWTF